MCVHVYVCRFHYLMFYCNLFGTAYLSSLPALTFFHGRFLYYCPRHINCWVGASFPIAALVFLSACACHFLAIYLSFSSLFQIGGLVVVVECLSSLWSLCLWPLLLALWECGNVLRWLLSPVLDCFSGMTWILSMPLLAITRDRSPCWSWSRMPVQWSQPSRDMKVGLAISFSPRLGIQSQPATLWFGEWSPPCDWAAFSLMGLRR